MAINKHEMPHLHTKRQPMKRKVGNTRQNSPTCANTVS